MKRKGKIKTTARENMRQTTKNKKKLNIGIELRSGSLFKSRLTPISKGIDIPS